MFTDRQGSARDVTDTSGTVLDHIEYTAFGGIRSETASAYGGTFLYTGLFEDRTAGTVNADARTELTAIDRWMQIDPITFSGGQSNLYEDVGNDPTNATDPSGLESLEVYKGTLQVKVLDAVNTTSEIDVQGKKLAVDKHEDAGLGVWFKRAGFVQEWQKDNQVFKVSQLMQIEVSGKYSTACAAGWKELPAGKKLETGKQHGDHIHISQLRPNPKLQPDNGEHPMKGGFSEGPYAPAAETSTDMMVYWDRPNAAKILAPAAEEQLSTVPGYHAADLTDIRIIQRFITYVYIDNGNKPAATIHWTSTWEDAAGKTLAQQDPKKSPVVEIINVFGGYKDAKEAIALGKANNSDDQ